MLFNDSTRKLILDLNGSLLVSQLVLVSEAFLENTVEAQDPQVKFVLISFIPSPFCSGRVWEICWEKRTHPEGRIMGSL